MTRKTAVHCPGDRRGTGPSRRTLLQAALASLATPAFAQGDVSRIVVPFAAGGARELPARLIIDDLARALGQTWIIDNKPGAGGAIGTSFVGKSAPDGRTLLMAASSHFVTAALGGQPKYDPVKDFEPVALLGTQSYVLLTRASLPVKTMAELVAYCKARPGACNYNSAGVASSSHLAAAYFCKLAGIDATHIPYKSTQEAVNDMLGGRGELSFVPTAGLSVYLQDARVRILATTDEQRTPLLPKVPTVAESGLPSYVFESWFGLLAPAHTPAATVERLNTTINRIVASPTVDSRLKGAGIEPRPMRAQEFAQLFLRDQALMTKVVRDSGIRRE